LRNDSGTVTINNSAFVGHIVTALYNNNGALTINILNENQKGANLI